MHLSEISKFAIKLAGLFLVIYVIASAPWYITTLLLAKSNSVGEVFFMAVLPMAIPLLLGFFLWSMPGKINNHIIRGDGTKVFNQESSRQILSMVIFLFGIIFLFYSCSDMAYNLFVYFKMKAQAERFDIGLPVKEYANIFATSIEIILAVAMMKYRLKLIDFAQLNHK